MLYCVEAQTGAWATNHVQRRATKGGTGVTDKILLRNQSSVWTEYKHSKVIWVLWTHITSCKMSSARRIVSSCLLFNLRVLLIPTACSHPLFINLQCRHHFLFLTLKALHMHKFGFVFLAVWSTPEKDTCPFSCLMCSLLCGRLVPDISFSKWIYIYFIFLKKYSDSFKTDFYWTFCWVQRWVQQDHNYEMSSLFHWKKRFHFHIYASSNLSAF